MGFTEKDERFYYDINSHSIDILVDKILSGNSNYTLDIYKDKGLMSDALHRVEQEINHRKSNELLKEDEIGRLKNDEFLKNKAKQDVITFCNEIEEGIWSLDEIKVKMMKAHDLVANSQKEYDILYEEQYNYDIIFEQIIFVLQTQNKNGNVVFKIYDCSN